MSLKAKIGGIAAGLLVMGGLALAASPAHAATANMATVLFNNTTAGEAGYYGADDNHTHYRFTETTVEASPSLVNLNGDTTPGVVGTELCDPNTGSVAEIGLWWNASDGKYEISYEGPGVTNYNKLPIHISQTDPCVQSGISAPLGDSSGDAPELVGPAAADNGYVINKDDQVYLGEYYTPTGRHYHQISFGACDLTQGWCVQAYGGSKSGLEFWEFGTGALTTQFSLTAPADNLLETFNSSRVTCYGCKSSIPISDVLPVGGFGGGLTEAQYINSSSQVVMSPNGSLSGSDFSLYEGSTSS